MKWFLIFIFPLCGFQKHRKSGNESIVKVEIRTAREITQTFKAIPCEGFETAYGGDVELVTLSDKRKVQEYMDHFERADTLPDGNVDVWQKIYVFYRSGKVDTICRSLFSQEFYRNGVYFSEKK